MEFTTPVSVHNERDQTPEYVLNEYRMYHGHDSSIRGKLLSICDCEVQMADASVQRYGELRNVNHEDLRDLGSKVSREEKVPDTLTFDQTHKGLTKRRNAD
jgi:hypothetical protein